MIKRCLDCNYYKDGICENGIFITFGHQVGLRDCLLYLTAKEMMQEEYDDDAEFYEYEEFDE